MLRRLLNFASILSPFACVALMGLWAFSSVCDEAVHGSLTDAVGDFQIASIQGRLSILMLPGNTRPGIGYWPQTPLDDHKSHVGEPPIHYEYGTITPSNWRWSRRVKGSKRQTNLASLGFSASIAPNAFMMLLPYWFLVLASGSLGMLFRLRWPWRFNLRSVFAATTFLAVVLGMIAWLDRAWIGK